MRSQTRSYSTSAWVQSNLISLAEMKSVRLLHSPPLETSAQWSLRLNSERSSCTRHSMREEALQSMSGSELASLCYHSSEETETCSTKKNGYRDSKTYWATLIMAYWWLLALLFKGQFQQWADMVLKWSSLNWSRFCKTLLLMLLTTSTIRLRALGCKLRFLKSSSFSHLLKINHKN